MEHPPFLAQPHSPFLTLERVEKSFAGAGKTTKVVNDVSLSFCRGEFVTILGPSGCGKTTLLNLIAGIERPDAGNILLDNENITALAPESRNFGMVFQNYALFPNLTVIGNITYGLHGSAWNRRRRRERAEELICLAALQGLENRLPAQLSGGQQQRVALARALAPGPRLLLLDEPLSALDAQVRLALGQELRQIQRKTKVTTIMVTHDQQEALALADQIVLMNQGTVVQTGSPESLYTRPACRFSAEFVGHMNIIALPEIGNGQPIGLRYEDVTICQPSEWVLRQPHTLVGRVAHSALMGTFYRLELELGDFSTRVYADVPRTCPEELTREHALVAVTLPEHAWHLIAREEA